MLFIGELPIFFRARLFKLKPINVSSGFKVNEASVLFCKTFIHCLCFVQFEIIVTQY